MSGMDARIPEPGGIWTTGGLLWTVDPRIAGRRRDDMLRQLTGRADDDPRLVAAAPWLDRPTPTIALFQDEHADEAHAHVWLACAEYWTPYRICRRDVGEPLPEWQLRQLTAFRAANITVRVKDRWDVVIPGMDYERLSALPLRDALLLVRYGLECDMSRILDQWAHDLYFRQDGPFPAGYDRRLWREWARDRTRLISTGCLAVQLLNAAAMYGQGRVQDANGIISTVRDVYGGVPGFDWTPENVRAWALDHAGDVYEMFRVLAADRLEPESLAETFRRRWQHA